MSEESPSNRHRRSNEKSRENIREYIKLMGRRFDESPSSTPPHQSSPGRSEENSLKTSSPRGTHKSSLNSSKKISLEIAQTSDSASVEDSVVDDAHTNFGENKSLYRVKTSQTRTVDLATDDDSENSQGLDEDPPHFFQEISYSESVHTPGNKDYSESVHTPESKDLENCPKQGSLSVTSSPRDKVASKTKPGGLRRLRSTERRSNNYETPPELVLYLKDGRGRAAVSDEPPALESELIATRRRTRTVCSSQIPSLVKAMAEKEKTSADKETLKKEKKKDKQIIMDTPPSLKRLAQDLTKKDAAKPLKGSSKVKVEEKQEVFNKRTLKQKESTPSRETRSAESSRERKTSVKKESESVSESEDLRPSTRKSSKERNKTTKDLSSKQNKEKDQQQEESSQEEEGEGSSSPENMTPKNVSDGIKKVQKTSGEKAKENPVNRLGSVLSTDKTKSKARKITLSMDQEVATNAATIANPKDSETTELNHKGSSVAVESGSDKTESQPTGNKGSEEKVKGKTLEQSEKSFGGDEVICQPYQLTSKIHSGSLEKIYITKGKSKGISGSDISEVCVIPSKSSMGKINLIYAKESLSRTTGTVNPKTIDQTMKKSVLDKSSCILLMSNPIPSKTSRLPPAPEVPTIDNSYVTDLGPLEMYGDLDMEEVVVGDVEDTTSVGVTIPTNVDTNQSHNNVFNSDSDDEGEEERPSATQGVEEEGSPGKHMSNSPVQSVSLDHSYTSGNGGDKSLKGSSSLSSPVSSPTKPVSRTVYSSSGSRTKKPVDIMLHKDKINILRQMSRVFNNEVLAEGSASVCSAVQPSTPPEIDLPAGSGGKDKATLNEGEFADKEETMEPQTEESSPQKKAQEEAADVGDKKEDSVDEFFSEIHKHLEEEYLKNKNEEPKSVATTSVESELPTKEASLPVNANSKPPTAPSTPKSVVEEPEDTDKVEEDSVDSENKDLINSDHIVHHVPTYTPMPNEMIKVESQVGRSGEHIDIIDGVTFYSFESVEEMRIFSRAERKQRDEKKLTPMQKRRRKRRRLRQKRLKRLQDMAMNRVALKSKDNLEADVRLLRDMECRRSNNNENSISGAFARSTEEGVTRYNEDGTAIGGEQAKPSTSGFTPDETKIEEDVTEEVSTASHASSEVVVEDEVNAIDILYPKEKYKYYFDKDLCKESVADGANVFVRRAGKLVPLTSVLNSNKDTQVIENREKNMVELVYVYDGGRLLTLGGSLTKINPSNSNSVKARVIVPRSYVKHLTSQPPIQVEKKVEAVEINEDMAKFALSALQSPENPVEKIEKEEEVGPKVEPLPDSVQGKDTKVTQKFTHQLSKGLGKSVTTKPDRKNILDIIAAKLAMSDEDRKDEDEEGKLKAKSENEIQTVTNANVGEKKEIKEETAPKAERPSKALVDICNKGNSEDKALIGKENKPELGKSFESAKDSCEVMVEKSGGAILLKGNDGSSGIGSEKTEGEELKKDGEEKKKVFEDGPILGEGDLLEGVNSEKKLPEPFVEGQQQTGVSKIFKRNYRRFPALSREMKRLNMNFVKFVPQEEEEADKIEDQEAEECQKEHCVLGCVCESLKGKKRVRDHCGRVECMFGCTCKDDSWKHSTDLDSSRTINAVSIFNLDREQQEGLALREKDFKRTVIQTGSEVILVGGERRKRERRIPDRFRDSAVWMGSDLVVAENNKDDSNSDEPFVHAPGIHIDDAHFFVKPLRLKIPWYDIKGVSIWCMDHSCYDCKCIKDPSYRGMEVGVEEEEEITPPLISVPSPIHTPEAICEQEKEELLEPVVIIFNINVTNTEARRRYDWKLKYWLHPKTCHSARTCGYTKNKIIREFKEVTFDGLASQAREMLPPHIQPHIVDSNFVASFQTKDSMPQEHVASFTQLTAANVFKKHKMSLDAQGPQLLSRFPDVESDPSSVISSSLLSLDSKLKRKQEGGIKTLKHPERLPNILSYKRPVSFGDLVVVEEKQKDTDQDVAECNPDITSLVPQDQVASVNQGPAISSLKKHKVFVGAQGTKLVPRSTEVENDPSAIVSQSLISLDSKLKRKQEVITKPVQQQQAAEPHVSAKQQERLPPILPRKRSLSLIDMMAAEERRGELELDLSECYPGNAILVSEPRFRKLINMNIIGVVGINKAGRCIIGMVECVETMEKMQRIHAMISNNTLDVGPNMREIFFPQSHTPARPRFVMIRCDNNKKWEIVGVVQKKATSDKQGENEKKEGVTPSVVPNPVIIPPNIRTATFANKQCKPGEDRAKQPKQEPEVIDLEDDEPELGPSEIKSKTGATVQEEDEVVVLDQASDDASGTSTSVASTSVGDTSIGNTLVASTGNTDTIVAKEESDIIEEEVREEGMPQIASVHSAQDTDMLALIGSPKPDDDVVVIPSGEESNSEVSPQPSKPVKAIPNLLPIHGTSVNQLSHAMINQLTNMGSTTPNLGTEKGAETEKGKNANPVPIKPKCVANKEWQSLNTGTSMKKIPIVPGPASQRLYFVPGLANTAVNVHGGSPNMRTFRLNQFSSKVFGETSGITQTSPVDTPSDASSSDVVPVTVESSGASPSIVQSKTVKAGAENQALLCVSMTPSNTPINTRASTSSVTKIANVPVSVVTKKPGAVGKPQLGIQIPGSTPGSVPSTLYAVQPPTLGKKTTGSPSGSTVTPAASSAKMVFIPTTVGTTSSKILLLPTTPVVDPKLMMLRQSKEMYTSVGNSKMMFMPTTAVGSSKMILVPSNSSDGSKMVLLPTVPTESLSKKSQPVAAASSKPDIKSTVTQSKSPGKKVKLADTADSEGDSTVAKVTLAIVTRTVSPSKVAKPTMSDSTVSATSTTTTASIVLPITSVTYPKPPKTVEETSSLTVTITSVNKTTPPLQEEEDPASLDIIPIENEDTPTSKPSSIGEDGGKQNIDVKESKNGKAVQKTDSDKSKNLTSGGKDSHDVNTKDPKANSSEARNIEDGVKEKESKSLKETEKAGNLKRKLSDHESLTNDGEPPVKKVQMGVDCVPVKNVSQGTVKPDVSGVEKGKLLAAQKKIEGDETDPSVKVCDKEPRTNKDEKSDAETRKEEAGHSADVSDTSVSETKAEEQVPGVPIKKAGHYWSSVDLALNFKSVKLDWLVGTIKKNVLMNIFRMSEKAKTYVNLSVKNGEATTVLYGLARHCVVSESSAIPVLILGSAMNAVMGSTRTTDKDLFVGNSVKYFIREQTGELSSYSYDVSGQYLICIASKKKGEAGRLIGVGQKIPVSKVRGELIPLTALTATMNINLPHKERKEKVETKKNEEKDNMQKSSQGCDCLRKGNFICHGHASQEVEIVEEKGIRGSSLSPQFKGKVKMKKEEEVKPSGTSGSHIKTIDLDAEIRGSTGNVETRNKEETEEDMEQHLKSISKTLENMAFIMNMNTETPSTLSDVTSGETKLGNTSASQDSAGSHQSNSAAVEDDIDDEIDVEECEETGPSILSLLRLQSAMEKGNSDAAFEKTVEGLNEKILTQQESKVTGAMKRMYDGNDRPCPRSKKKYKGKSEARVSTTLFPASGVMPLHPDSPESSRPSSSNWPSSPSTSKSSDSPSQLLPAHLAHLSHQYSSYPHISYNSEGGKKTKPLATTSLKKLGQTKRKMKKLLKRKKVAVEKGNGRSEIHNQLERLRRLELKLLFEALQGQLPKMSGSSSEPKINILTRGTKMCSQLKAEEVGLKTIEEDLRERRKTLIDKLAALLEDVSPGTKVWHQDWVRTKLCNPTSGKDFVDSWEPPAYNFMPELKTELCGLQHALSPSVSLESDSADDESSRGLPSTPPLYPAPSWSKPQPKTAVRSKMRKMLKLKTYGKTLPGLVPAAATTSGAGASAASPSSTTSILTTAGTSSRGRKIVRKEDVDFIT
ncbi:uncharacterized protein LOC143022424 isoform X3 [Oratosquilla oratoria]|uniref:uncharacterized protein LOC143022424 isoform X3 n=1 Tax=Oratosquilla oratoria TaxID=337810 RepID=UPI003F76986C